MNKIGRFFIVVLLFFCSVLPGMAFDFGLVIQQSPEYTNTGEYNTGGDGELNYTGSYSPWLSSELGKTANLYLSAKVSTVYEWGEWKPGNMPVLLEVGRFEILWHPKFSLGPLSSFTVEAGRMPFQEASGFVASGLFDGFTGSAVLGPARLSVGAFYTGLLYKETAEIKMTPSDTANYTNNDKYFASRRLLFSLGAELPVLTDKSSLALNGLFQFDVNNEAVTLHTQYLTAKYTYQLLETLSLSGTAVMELAEDQNDMSIHFATAAGADWEVPGDLRDMFQGEVRWASGEFTPLSGIAQGQVFTPTLPGLLIIKGKYTTRFFRNFSASLEGSYFIRTDDSGTVYLALPDLLGGEIYAALSWAPVSDLMAALGGGFFFPGSGSTQWKIRAGLTVSL